MTFSIPITRVPPTAHRPRALGGARLPALVLALVLAVLVAGCGRVVALQAGLSDADANDIALVLNRKGIEVEKQKGKDGVALLVAAGDLSRATEAMHAAGLPRRALSNLGEVFKKQGMISSPMEERIRYIHGLSEELESTMLQFDNVVAARVHVVLPERVAPGEPIQPSSAAVFIKYRPPMDEDAVLPRVRRLVASSIPGLSGEHARDKVSVVLVPGAPPDAGIEWTMLGPFTVATASVNGLMLTIGALFLVALGSSGTILVRMALRNPRVARLVLALSTRAAARKAGAGAAAPTASAPARQGI